MPLFTRSPRNPILNPAPENEWESYAAFNGSVIKSGGMYHLFYRAMTGEKTYLGKKMRLSSIGHAQSADGVSFGNRKPFVTPEFDWELFGCEDPRVTEMEGRFYTFYTALSGFPPNYRTIKVAVAVSDEIGTVAEKHLVTPFNAKAMTLFPRKINGKYAVLLTADTDKPPSTIALARFDRIETLWDRDFWEDWYENLEEHRIPLQRVTTDQVEIGAPPLKTDRGWVLLHSYIKNYFQSEKQFRIEAVLLDPDDPRRIKGRIVEPCLVPEEPYEKKGQIADVVFPEGALIEQGRLKMFYGAADSTCCQAEADLKEFMSRFETNTPEAIKCQRFPNNPLLQPFPKHDWESKAVFNPAAIELEGNVYLLYRALSQNDISTVGLAVSQDGMFVDERLPLPVYVPRTPEETAPDKKGGYGCEDPRITRIGDTLYLLYTAYDGRLPRLAMSSITVADFLARQWDKWALPKIISPPGVADKDGCLFPEKVNGRYAFFHRIEPHIAIDFTPDLAFGKKQYLEDNIKILPRANTWDDIKIGINAPPLKTEEGWIVFYHGISRLDHNYRLGALLLDLEDLGTVTGRTEYPLLEPVTYYEKEGVVNNVVFPCGYVEKEGDIILYYGGADKVVGGARISRQTLLTHLVKSREAKYLASV